MTEKIINVGMLMHPPSLSGIKNAIEKNHPFLHFVLKRLPDHRLKSALKKIGPFLYLKKKDFLISSNVKINFYSIMLPLLPEQIVSASREEIERKIRKMMLIADKKKISLVTLGAFTSIVTNQGKDIIGKYNCKVTTGNTYTAALCVFSIFDICKKVNLKPADTSIAILGGRGDIGSACLRRLVNHFKTIIVCVRRPKAIDNNFLKCIPKYLHTKVEIVSSVSEAIRKAEIIVCATSSLTPLINDDNLPSGKIVCDLSVPANVSSGIAVGRKDVLIFEGGRCQFDELSSNIPKNWSHIINEELIYGCLAETLILGLENRIENYSIGKGEILLEKIDEIYAIGKKHGFQISKYLRNSYEYTKSDFSAIEKIIKDRTQNAIN